MPKAPPVPRSETRLLRHDDMHYMKICYRRHYYVFPKQILREKAYTEEEVDNYINVFNFFRYIKFFQSRPNSIQIEDVQNAENLNTDIRSFKYKTHYIVDNGRRKFKILDLMYNESTAHYFIETSGGRHERYIDLTNWRYVSTWYEENYYATNILGLV